METERTSDSSNISSSASSSASFWSTSSNTVSTQNSLPPTHDPGWNDPPDWALSSQHNSSGTSTRRLLNKRVSFPLFSEQVSSPEQVKTSHLPPSTETLPIPCTISTAPHKPLLAPMDKDLLEDTSIPDFNKDDALKEVLTNLITMITLQNMEKTKDKEIRKRLDNMASDWRADNIDDKVQKLILNMSRALINKDLEKADRIQTHLVTRYGQVCRYWIPTIRHIIFEMKENIKKETISQPRSPFDWEGKLN
ncbi:steroid receptor RNA activator 1-like [Pogonomyrmex barbatus]|uniref:Steroid receptor RNA activator 1-like n=1 Tax=Pogonomyrmex barbatus TaxID=144034 RepID=A0A6I9WZ04_9HYME|nr:steroid receptor RNA activator 1-like [Pogonomyrmex barbatus]